MGSCLFWSSACTTLGPDYVEPDVEAVKQWEQSLYKQVDVDAKTATIQQNVWWQVFEDPVLDRLVEIAKAENLNLRIAGLRILESRAALGIAQSTRYPQLQQADGNTNYINTQDSDNNEESFTNWQTGFTLGWEADFWGRFERGIESADAAFFGSISSQRDVQVLIVSQVVSSYYTYRANLLQVEIAKKNAEIQKRSFEITQQLFDSGQQSELDLQQAKTQYFATLSSIPRFELASLQAKNALCLLLGRAPGNLPELPESTDPLPLAHTPLLDQLPAALLLQRPDVRSAAWQVAAQSPQVGIAEAALYPSISLGGNISAAGNSLDGTADTYTLGVGPSFTWNLFDHGSIRSNVRVQDARLQQALENFENVVLQAAQEIDNAALSLLKVREQLEPQRGSLVAAQRSLELANINYKEGYADFQRVLDAQRSVAAQASNELSIQAQLIASITSLYGALGMGWESQSIEEMLPEETLETMEARTNWADQIREPLPAENDSKTKENK